MIFYRRTYRPRAGRREVALSAAACLGLAGLVAWFAGRGRAGNPALFAAPDAALTAAAPAPRIYERLVVTRRSAAVVADAVEAALGPEIPGGAFRRAGPVERYGPGNLYEKINGRETLYKSYGFERLWAASYAAGGETVDVEVFRHADAAGAFGVFSTERQAMRGGAGGATHTETPNGRYALIGRHYVRTQGSAASAAVLAACRAVVDGLRAALVEAPGDEESAGPEAGRDDDAGEGGTGPPPGCPGGYGTRCTPPPGPGGPAPGAGGPAPEAGAPAPEAGGAAPDDPTLTRLLAEPGSWTPVSHPLLALGADPASLEYHAEYGLGVEEFAKLHAAVMPADPAPTKAFLVAFDDAAAAEAALQAYRAAMGAAGAAASPDWPPGLSASRAAYKLDMLDTYEVAVRVNHFVAGVTEAEDAGAAMRVTGALAAALKPVTRGPRLR